jgi:hypothetical protein
MALFRRRFFHFFRALYGEETGSKGMLGRFSVVLLIGLTRVAIAADTSGDFPSFPSDQSNSTAPASSVLSYGVNTPIQTLAANPATAAIVKANIPGLLEDDNFPFFKGMSLKTVASLSHGQISSDTLHTIAAQLKSVLISTAAN